MNRKLSRNVLSAAIQLLTQTLVLVVLYRFLLDTIGVERLGIWSIVLAAASAARVSELGMAGSVTKYVAGYRAKGDYQAAAESLQTAALSLAGALGVILIAIYPGLLWALPHILPPEGLKEGQVILPYGMLSLWLTAVASIWMSGLDGCLRTDLRAGILISGSVIYLLVSFASVSHYGLVGLAAAQVVQGMMLLIVGWLVIRRIMGLSHVVPAQWSNVRFKEMFKYGLNFQINSVVMLLFEPITKVLLGRFGELSAAGYFEMAQRLVMTVRGLIVESNRVIVPVFASMDAQGGDVLGLYIRNMRYLLLLVTPVFSTLLAFIPTVSELWIGSFQWQFFVMSIFLTLGWYVNSIGAPAYFAYLGQGKLTWVTVGHVAMGTSNIVAGMVLGYLHGWQGVIFAFMASLLIGSVIPIWAYHREHRLKVMRMLLSYDGFLIAICFGVASIALSLSIISPGVGENLGTHIFLTAVAMAITVTISIWFHPLLQKT